MREPQEPLFLARQSYRRRRLMDAARILPVAGLLLFGLPLLWTRPGTGSGALYLFSAWAALIVASFLISRNLVRGAPREGSGGRGDEGR